MIHGFVHLFVLFFNFYFHSVIRKKQNSSFSFFINSWSGHLAGMKWSVCISKSLIIYLLIDYCLLLALADGLSLDCDSKSSQVSRTLLSILNVLNNAVVLMVSTRPPTSKSSSSFINSLVTVWKAPVKIGIIVTFMFHSFFNSLARSRYLSFFWSVTGVWVTASLLKSPGLFSEFGPFSTIL